MRQTWLFGIWFLVSCGGPMPISPRELCEGIQQVHCANLFACATTTASQELLKAMYDDEADCVMQGLDLQRPACGQWTEDNVCGSFGSSAWNGAAAATCLKDLGVISCSKVFIGYLPPSCGGGSYCL